MNVENTVRSCICILRLYEKDGKYSDWYEKKKNSQCHDPDKFFRRFIPILTERRVVISFLFIYRRAAPPTQPWVAGTTHKATSNRTE